MAWEVFSKKVIRTGEPVITLGKMGRVAFNQIATNVLRQKSVEYVVLLWDKEHYKCGVRPSNSKEANAYKLTYNEKYNGCGFSAVTFLNYIRYDWTVTRAFNADWDAHASMFIFDIPVEHFGTKGNLSQPLGNMKRTDRREHKGQEATEVAS